MAPIPAGLPNLGWSSRKFEAEEVLLGSMLLSEASADLVLSRTEESNFFTKKHRLIFRAIKRLHADGTVIDYITVKDLIREWRQLRRVGGPNGILALLGRVVEGMPLKYYVKVLRGRAG